MEVLVYVVILIVLAGAVYFSFFNKKKEIDRMIKQAEEGRIEEDFEKKENIQN